MNVLILALATLRRKRGSLLAFAAAMFGFMLVTAAAFPAIGGAEAVSGVIGTFPPQLRRLLRIAPNLQAGFGLRDYMALSFFHPVYLGLGAAFVVGRATDALTGEVERGSIYLLLSRPVARWTLVLGKMSELLAGAGVLALAGWLGLVVAGATALEPLPLGRYLLVALLAWPLFGALGAGALVISAPGRRSGTVAGIASAWTLISFPLRIQPGSRHDLPRLTGVGPRQTGNRAAAVLIKFHPHRTALSRAERDAAAVVGRRHGRSSYLPAGCRTPTAARRRHWWW